MVLCVKSHVKYQDKMVGVEKEVGFMEKEVIKAQEKTKVE